MLHDTSSPRPSIPTRPVPEHTSQKERIVRFLLAGLANTGFGYALYAVLVFAGLPPQAALALQFAIGVLWNYTIHGRFVFGTRGYSRLPRYFGAYVVVYLFNAVLLQSLIGVGLGPYLSQAIALAPTVVLSYILVSAALGVPLRENGRQE